MTGPDADAELPPHPPSTYVGVGVFFVVAAIAAAVFGYLALQTDAQETDSTGHPVADTAVEGASGVLTVQTGWLAIGASVVAAAIALGCFFRASKA